VVIYQAVISAPNADLRLLPGMTANLLVEASESDGVLRVPNAALKFRPTSAVFAALHEPLPAVSRLNQSATAIAANDAPSAKAGPVGHRAPADVTAVDRLFATRPPLVNAR